MKMLLSVNLFLTMLGIGPDEVGHYQNPNNPLQMQAGHCFLGIPFWIAHFLRVKLSKKHEWV